MNIIERKKYIEKITPFIGKSIIKVLTGARRCGKTYLLLQLIEKIKNENSEANIIYINKESAEFRNLINHTALYEYVKSKSDRTRKNYVFVDEIQEIEKFEIALRELLSENYDIYCTGSNARMLSSDLATVLSGRYIEIPVYSLSYAEFLQFHQLQNTKETLLKYIKYGGLPYLIHLPMDDEIVYQYLQSVYNTIILKDIVWRYNIRDVDFLNRLIIYLAENTGNYVSAKKITDFIKSQKLHLSINSVQNYLHYLANAFFVDQVKRYDIRGKKVFEVNEKYFFRDLGLKHAVLPFQPNDLGKIMENLVYNHLIVNDYKVYIGKFDDKEIDFYAVRGTEILYVQVAYLLPDQSTYEREFGNLLKIEDNYRKMVVTADELAQGQYKGIEHIYILDFLTRKL